MNQIVPGSTQDSDHSVTDFKSQTHFFEEIQDFLVSKWQGATPSARECAIALGDGSLIDFSIPTAIINDFTMDQANEGIFATITFTATSSEDGGGNLAVIKCT